MTSATKNDLTVTSTATMQDAQLLVSLTNGPMAGRAMDAIQLLLGYEQPPTWEKFNQEHPRGSTAAGDVAALLNFFETIGTFVKRGLLDRGLVYDLFWVTGVWERTKNIALHQREQAGEPEIYANFERLAAGQP